MSFPNLPSFRQAKFMCGVVASAPGSLKVRSSVEALGVLKEVCGMLNSYDTVELHLVVCCFTTIC